MLVLDLTRTYQTPNRPYGAVELIGVWQSPGGTVELWSGSGGGEVGSGRGRLGLWPVDNGQAVRAMHQMASGGRGRRRRGLGSEDV